MTKKKNGVSVILETRKGKNRYDILFEGKYVCPRKTRGTHQSVRRKKYGNDEN